MKVAVLSLADIGNYGDVFFPYVIREELNKRLSGAEIVIVTNTEYNCDLFSTVAYDEALLQDFDAIIYGGGEMISPYDDRAFRDTYGEGYCGTPSDIGNSWLDREDKFKAFFSVGIHPIMLENEHYLERVLLKSDYLSVRGIISKKVADGDYRYNNDKIRISPDLGWLFPRYIDLSSAVNPIKESMGDYAVFQMIEDEILEPDYKKIAFDLLRFSKESGIHIVLLPIMRTKKQWNENIAHRKLMEASEGELVTVTSDPGIMEIGRIIKDSMFFVGSSLHGAITSMAYGKPAVNIRSSVNTKLQDIHGNRCRSTCFVNSYEPLYDVLCRSRNESQNEEDHKYALMYSEYMQYRLGREFDNLARGIENHFNKK